jgi:3-isopropylmalate dehydrogenase
VSQQGILQLRREFDFYVNLRPIRVMPHLETLSALRPELAERVDLMVIRELGSGIYFGPSGSGTDQHGAYAFHSMRYYDDEIRRIARHALDWAARRSGRLTVAHKENALPRIKWQDLVREEAEAFPGVEIQGMLVDSLAMELVRAPSKFDVILAGNLFGDILSDLGGAITGSIGLLPSASLNDVGLGLYEPVHGTAPDIAGKGIANPLGMIGSMEMMLSQWGLPRASARLRRAQELALLRGLRTADLASGSADRVVSTQEMATAVADNLEEVAEIEGEELLRC